ncbi:MAG: PorV/PorQ family protein [Bacteroidetes bacterium]|nr:PorV/PorQ family protein [Bacteroidota bacterium]MBP8753588.1 PorV/PorQ family protein [Chitinophagales bacterium]MBK7108708.1 PorV/PorQ family protein [Bacteroidota bacterium]MBK8488966.1 PorV/PorQ family protein [Bacteroidota bacterium]MBK8680814.1 PorV/PorQ family protein [Bacteroidota bacterium]
MRGFLKVKVFVVLLALAGKVIAGNPDRAGQSGASEILINPWAQSSGWYGLNVASIQGLESMNVNVAGLTFINRTDMTFSRTEWLVGSDISINSFGIAQKVGEGAIGLSLVNFNLGDIPVTTTASPEGTGATFRPRLSNFALSYSRKFADYLSGGLTIRGISENISDLKAFGVALDVGIQYITGPEEHPEQMKMGVTLKNIGSPMRYGGDGITFRGNVPEGTYTATVGFPTEYFELPSSLSIGLSYDFYFGTTNRLTAVGTFISNSFSKDQFGLGLEYGLKVKNTEMFLLRAGYRYEDGMLSSNADERTTAHTGLAAGVTFQTAFANSSSNMLSISYSYRSSNPYDGTHSFGIRLSI